MGLVVGSSAPGFALGAPTTESPADFAEAVHALSPMLSATASLKNFNVEAVDMYSSAPRQIGHSALM